MQSAAPPRSVAAERAAEGGTWLRFAAPQRFYPLAGRLLPWCWGVAAVFAVAGLVVGLLVAPTDFQQGDSYRIIFIHVPAAWMSMLIYVVMAGWAGLGLVLNTRLSSMMASALAPTGALMTFIALQAATEDARRADRAGAVLALVGVVNVPIIYFSVQWWNTLHQGSSVSITRAPTMATVMFTGMMLMVVAFWAYSIGAALHRVRSIILERERATEWVQQLQETGT